ncbi:MAG: adventurous gliding motility lipoprotein CglB [Archangiaceae bacterium]|nr:adventurous gliding motility lipoprotein CglB [Archangiaceae bacterium]
MLVVDRSMSMSFPMENGESRWTQLTRAFGRYLTEHGTAARLGLMTFPTGDACGAGNVAVDLWTQSDTATDLQAHADGINRALQATQPGGVTPTGESLKKLIDYMPLQSGRENVVVVATDGLPNCNPDNPNSYDANPTACDCSFIASQCGGSNARLSCIDRDGTVNVVRQLRQRGVKTAVVGFGADALQGTGPLVMNAIASEGGAPRLCPSGADAECGTTNRCDPATHVCELRYYQATNDVELAAALATIGYSLTTGEACVVKLDAPPADPRFLSVLLDGQQVDPAAWSYASGDVTFQGAACDRLKSSTPDDPAQLTFRTVEVL